jgi:hypothetical protein
MPSGRLAVLTFCMKSSNLSLNDQLLTLTKQ